MNERAMPRGWRLPRMGYLGRSLPFVSGVAMLLGLLLFAGIGRLVIDTSLSEPLSAMPNQPPSWETPFGSDSQGRDLLAVLVLGTWLTMKVGLLAGLMGITIGTTAGLVSAYCGGIVDLGLRWLIDVGLTIPPLLLLIVIASSLRGHLDSTGMALIIGMLSWFGPARQIRAQALIMRQSGYVLTARLSGRSGTKIVFLEMLPNLLPFLMAALVLASSAAILSSVGSTRWGWARWTSRHSA